MKNLLMKKLVKVLSQRTMITIIVMMILVAVTVTFTIGENGILVQAKESAKLAEKAQLHEQIMGQIELTNEGKIKIQETYEAAEIMLKMQGYEVGDLQADGIFEVTGKKGTYKYKIAETEITIEENVREDIGDDTSDEEIVWACIDMWGEFYALLYIGDDEQIEITEDKEVKAYVGKLNEDTEEYEYKTEEITSIRFSEVEEINIERNVQKLTVGQVIKEAYIICSLNIPLELVISGDYGDIPEYSFADINIEKLVIEEGITTIESYAFYKNPLIAVTIPESVTSIGEFAISGWNKMEENIIYYGGTKEQWKEIEMDIDSAFSSIRDDAKIVFADGTQEPLFPTEE